MSFIEIMGTEILGVDDIVVVVVTVLVDMEEIGAVDTITVEETTGTDTCTNSSILSISNTDPFSPIISCIQAIFTLFFMKLDIDELFLNLLAML